MIFELDRGGTNYTVNGDLSVEEWGESSLKLMLFDGGNWSESILNREEALAMSVAIIEWIKSK